MRISLFAAAALAVSLAACAGAPGIIAQNETAHISKIQVSAAPGVSSPRFAEMLQARATHQSARFGQAGAAKELRIVVERHSYKNPALSLLVGDANVASGRVAVVDAGSGRVEGEAQAGAVDTLAVNGIAGAIIAAAQNKDEVDKRLADEFAKAALRHAYGTARAEQVFAQPEPVPAIAPAAPASGAKPAPKPGAKPASKPVPVAAKSADTAVAALPAPVAR